MKKLITILFAVMLTFSLSAQQFGLKAGLNIASAVYEEDGPDDSRIGMNIGALIMFELSDAVDLRTGLIYNQKGAAQKDAYDPYYGYSLGDVTLALDYLEIPVDIAFEVADGFSLSAGPYLAFLMSAKVKNDGGDTDVKESFNGMDMGINIGASFLINESILIDARYGLGLMDVTDIESYYDYSDASSDKNSCFSISIGYVFGG